MKQDINNIIHTLTTVMKRPHTNKNERLKDIGIDLLIKLLDVTSNNNEEDFKYILDQIIIKSPELTGPLVKIVNETYPQFKERIEKLIILQ